MIRELFDHKTNVCNEAIRVVSTDDEGPGGAHHEYQAEITHLDGSKTVQSISFQNGPIGEVGTNGTTHEVLLTILIDRFRSFQSGQYACHENAQALLKLEEAMHWMHSRTMARAARGVEGTSKI